MSNEITIIIADDHPIVRKGLRETIEEESSFIILAEVNNGQEAIEAIERFNPNVTILDVDMPIMNGFDAAREIKSRKIETEIIFLTMHRDEDLFNEAWQYFQRHEDKGYSFTDCISFVVMKTLGIEMAFAFDKHFATPLMEQQVQPAEFCIRLSHQR